jgi:hypothetical protein
MQQGLTRWRIGTVGVRTHGMFRGLESSDCGVTQRPCGICNGLSLDPHSRSAASD